MVFSFVVAIALVLTHRKNVGRLLDGSESKIDVWKYFGVDLADKFDIAAKLGLTEQDKKDEKTNDQ